MLLLCVLLFATSSLADNFEDADNCNMGRRGAGDHVIFKDDPYLQSATDHEMFQGDILLPKEQVKAIKNGLDPASLGRARGLTHKYRVWAGGIGYYTIKTRRPITKRKILSAMREYEGKTSLRFMERTNQKDYIEFISGCNRGCYSRGVGRVGGKQTVALGFGCFGHGRAVHEIGHAIGCWHEQNRPDRDQYVDIICDNIKEDSTHNFKKFDFIDSMGVPYDYGTIMHYGKHDFAKLPWQVTIRPKKPGVEIGQLKHLSPLDVKTG